MNLAQDIQKAVEILTRGGIVAMPTETVYGLAANVHSSAGIEKIFATKERPFFDPLIVHVDSLERIPALVSHWSSLAQALAEEFWPGPLTMVLPKAAAVNPMVTSGLDTVGVRWPRHPLAQKLIAALDAPVAAPSANKFGRTSPTRAEHVINEFKGAVPVLDGGPCEVGVESTVLRVLDNKMEILRPGAVTAEALQKFLERRNLTSTVTVEHVTSDKASPGHTKHHYMPHIPVVLVSEGVAPEKLAAALRENLLVNPDECQELVFSEHPDLAARELYEGLRRIESSGATAILIKKYPHQTGGYWTAIWDRVGRAASLKL